MKEFLSKYLTVIPPILVLCSYASHFITMDAFMYNILGNLVGVSVLTNIVFIWVYFYSNKNYCWFTKLSVLCLLLLNITNIVSVLFGFEEFYNTYCFAYETIVTSFIVVLSIFLALRKL